MTERSATFPRAPAAASKTAFAVLLSLLTAPPRVGAYYWPDYLSSDDLRDASVAFGWCRTVAFHPDEHACRDCDIMCGDWSRGRRTEEIAFDSVDDCDLVCGECDAWRGSWLELPRKDFVEFNVCNNDDVRGQPVYDPFGNSREKDSLHGGDYHCEEECRVICDPGLIEELMNEEGGMEILQEMMPLNVSHFYNNSTMDDIDRIIDTCLKECVSSLCFETESSAGSGSVSTTVSNASVVSSFRSTPRGCQHRIMPLEEYLMGKVEFLSREQERMCTECEERCSGDGGSGDNDEDEFDCAQCADECEMIEDMRDNGYIDATEFLECQEIFDDGNQQLFAGPICLNYGSKVGIGIFLDESCTRPDLSKDVNDYVQDEDGYQIRLSYALLKHSYESWLVFPCSDDGEEGRRLDQEEEGWCFTLYQDSAPMPYYVYAQSHPFSDKENMTQSMMVIRANKEIKAFDVNGEELDLYFWQTNLTREVHMSGRALDEEGWDWAEEEKEYDEWTDEESQRDESLVLNLHFADHPSSEGGWVLQSSSLTNAYSGTKVAEWAAPLGELGSSIMRPDNETFFHCEYVEFSFDDPDGSDFGVVAVRDVLIGTVNSSQYGSPVCGSRIVNPCDGGEDELMCQFIDGSVECVEIHDHEGLFSPVLGHEYDGLLSPVPDLSRREYLDAFMCEEYNGWYFEDAHDYDEEYEYEPTPGWINKTNPEWSNYHVTPTQCIVHNDTELVLFSLHQYYCSDYLVGEYVAPLSVFINMSIPTLDDIFNDEDLQLYLECTESPDEVGRWLRVGCSEFSTDMLYVNSYSDPLCTEDRRAIEPSRYYIGMYYCQSCGPNPYPFVDDDAGAYLEEIEFINGEENGDDANWDDGDYADHDDNWVGDGANFLECSALQPYIQEECDQNCQDTILRHDLRWDGPNAFLQANNVTAFSFGYGFPFGDDTDCSDCIDSGTQGEMISRVGQKNPEGDEVNITMSFAPNNPTPGNSEAEDVSMSGWVMKSTHISNGALHLPGFLNAGRSMISVPPEKQLFHCEYMELNYRAGTFVGYDVVIGAYLPEDYDVCSLSMYNPCHENGQRSTCYAVDGSVRCLDAGIGNTSMAVMMRSSASSALPMCMGGGQDTPAADPLEPTISPVSQFDGTAAGVIVPTAAPSDSAPPTPEFSGGSQAYWNFGSSAFWGFVLSFGPLLVNV